MKKEIFFSFLGLLLISAMLYYFVESNQKYEKSTPKATSTLGVTSTSTNISATTSPTKVGWSTTSTNGYTFEYPKTLGTVYIHETDWPPQLQVLNKPYSCIESNTPPTLPAGQTKKEVINSHEYCVTVESEGAAGSTYTNYAYAFPKDTKTLIFTFGTRAAQCMNYDNPKQKECLDERDSFDIGKVMDEIVGGLRLR